VFVPGGNNPTEYPDAAGGIMDDFGSPTDYYMGAPSQPLNQYHVYEVTSQSNNWAAWINGQILYQTTNNTVAFNQSPSALGADFFCFAGDIAEVIVFNRGLATNERSTVNDYLNAKYGLVPAVPASPANLTATAISPTQISLGWNATLSGVATEISVERSTSSNGVFSVVAQVPNSLSYIDTNLIPGTTYYYRVRAINIALWSGYSNLAQATTPASGTVIPMGNLALWLKADSGLVQGTAGTAVGLWADQSGLGNNATQGSLGNQPQWVPSVFNGLPVVRFDGTNDFLTLPAFMSGATGGEAFVVLKSTTPSGGIGGLWSWGSFTFYVDVNLPPEYPAADGSIMDDFGSASCFQLGVPSVPLNQYHVYEVSSTSNNWAAWFNGQLQFSTTNNTVGFSSTSQTLGRDWFMFSGDVAEVLVFNRGLAANERGAVNGYLNMKYGLVPAIPASPTNLTAVAISPSQISLSWNEVLNETVTQISVERSTSSNGVFSAVAQVANTLSYIDTNLTSGTTYYYRVRAVNISQWSGYSNPAQATTLTNGTAMPISNLALWLKADAGVIQGPTNVAVGVWADQSGLGNNAVQTLPAARPEWVPDVFNGLPVVRFDGTNDALALPAFMSQATAGEAFVVLKTTTPLGGVGSLWSLSPFTFYVGYDNPPEYPAADGTISDDFGSANDNYMGEPVQPVSQYHVYEVTSQSNYWAAWINGELQYATTNNTVAFNQSPSTLGSDLFHFAGDIAEILVFTRGLTPAERLTIQGYLDHRYALAMAIPPTPTNVIATAISSNQISLSWYEPLNAAQIIIERAPTSAGPFSVLCELSNTLACIDGNLTPGASYYYRFQACYPAQYQSPYSGYSSVVGATTLTNGMTMQLPSLWLCADRGVLCNAAGQVSIWTDESGHANSASQASLASQPDLASAAVNGLPAVQFDGVASVLSIPNFLASAGGGEALVVLKANPLAGAINSLWEMGGAGGGIKEYPAANGAIQDDFGNSGVHDLNPVQSLTQFHVYDVASEPNDWDAWINGVWTCHSDNNSVSFADASTIGAATYYGYSVWGYVASGYFSGDIAEIMIFTNELTAAQRQALTAYLNNKYALEPAVPATPSNLVAHAISPTQISLTWDESFNDGATQISLERSTSSNGTYQVLAQLSAATSYVDTNLVTGSTYYYQVRAINLSQWSPYSPVASATTFSLGTNLPFASLALWLKADAGLFQMASNTPVNLWADQSGNGNVAVAGSAPMWVPNVIGGRPVVRFDGLSSSLSVTNFLNHATGAEAFVVLKVSTNNDDGDNPLWEMGGDGWNPKSYPAGTGVVADDFGSSGGYGSSGVHAFMTAQPLDQYHIYEVASQTNDWNAWINGVWQGHADANTVAFGGFTIGSAPYEDCFYWWVPETGFFSGDIAEVLVFNRGLTSDERAVVNDYLNGKYSLVPALPATPSNLVASAVSPTQVVLTWDALPNAGATRFSIERLNTTNLTYEELGVVSCATSYLDTNAAAGTTGYYRVRAINTDQWTPYCPPAEVTTPVSGPEVPFASLTAWLRADNGIWFNTNGMPVAFWPDLSGNENHASQSMLADQPVWVPGAAGHRPTLYFNGTNTSTTLPSCLGGAAEAFVVLETSVTNQFHSLWTFGGPEGYSPEAYPNVDGSISDNFGSDTVYSLGVPPQPLNQFHIYEAASELDNWQAWMNGQLLYQTSETSFNTVDFSGGMILGSSSYLVPDYWSWSGADSINGFFAGNISEILLFDHTLDDSERAAVNTYLARKYGIAPVVTITSPANNNVIDGPANIPLTATASDSAGISQVQFFAGSALVGAVTNAPYNLTWSNVPLGSYALTALATDNNGLAFTSAVVNITVAGIAITTPTNNTVFPAPANIPISAAVVDEDGVSQVQFFQGTNILATFTEEPYSFTWSNAPAGAYTLTAVATDDYGLTITSSVVNVEVDDWAVVTLTNPVNNARILAGTNLTLAASASEPGASIALVQFFAGTNLLGGATNAPFSLIWTNVPAGAFALSAQATDNNGLTSTSAVVNLMAVGIAITNPVNNTVMASPATESISAAVTDNAGILLVQYFQGTNSLGSATSAPYALNWANVPAGVYSVTATATDAGGFVFTSSPITVIVDTNPANTNRSGDGTSDYLDYLEGRNPLVGTVPDTNNRINFQVYTPLQ
jgi:fibronectin type 3 domain-containing protein